MACSHVSGEEEERTQNGARLAAEIVAALRAAGAEQILRRLVVDRSDIAQRRPHERGA